MAESSRDKYAEKMADLQKHVPFIETMITHLKSTQEKSREAQLNKLESLLQMITDTNKKWKYEILLKCEEVIDKLKCRMKPNLPSGAKAKQDKADKSRDNDTKPLTNPTKPKEIPQTQDDGLVQVSSNSDEDDYNDMNHESSYQRQNFHYKNYSHRKYRPFTKAEASNQTVILPILLEAIKDGSAANSRFPPHNEDNRRFESAPYRESTRKFENCSNPDRLSPIIGNFKNRFNSRHHHYKQFHRGSSYRNDASFRTSRSCEEEDDRDKGRNSANRSLSPTFESTKDSVVIDEIGKTPTQKESEGDATLNDVNLEDKLEVQPSEFDSLKITHTIEIDPRILLKYSTSSNQDSKKLTDESIKKENSSEVGVKTSNEKKKLNSKEEDAIAANYSKLDKMYSNLTTTGGLTSSIEALYSGSAPKKSFKIPKKQNNLKIVMEKKVEGLNAEVKSEILETIVPDNAKEEPHPIKSKPEGEEIQIDARNELSGDKIKKKKKVRRVFTESEKDLNLESKLSKEIAPKRQRKISGESKKRKSTSDEDKSKKTKIKEKSTTPLVNDSESVKDPPKSSEKLQEIQPKEEIKKEEEKSSKQIKELNLAKEIFKNTAGGSGGGSTNLLEFFLDNFKQIKKMFESSDSEDGSSSKKKKRKKKKKKHRKKYSSSSSSSSSSEDEEEDRRKKKKHKSELVRENEGNSKVSAAETKPKEVEPKPKGVEPKSKEVEPKPKEVLPKPKEVVPKPKEVMAKSKEVVPKPKEVVSKSKIDPAILKGDNPSPTTPVKDVLPKKKLNEQKPRKNELDFLHEDIKEMWMSGDIVRATGRRACTLTSKEEVAVIDTVKESTEKDDDADLRRSMIENASKLKVWIKRENFAKYFEKLTENCDESQRPVKKQKSRFPKKNLVIPENDNKNEHHDRNYYVQGVETPCRLCNYNGKMIFTHYKGKHPNNEVLISRLAPHIAEQLIVTSTERNYKNFNILDDLKVKCTFICPFCPNSNVISDYTAQFYDHLTIHTGEYRYFCERCDFSWYNQWNMRYHNKVKHRLRAKVITKNVPVNSEIVFGYICLECHFVQISKRNLEKHIQDYHGNSAGVLKINLNLADLSDKNDAVHEEEVVEEAEVKVEEPQIQNNLKGENEKKDLSPFICEEDLINEKTVEEVRLEKMNDILDNVNIQNIRITMAEKLQTKLVGDSEENVQSATSAKKSYKSYPKSKPSRLFVKEGIAPDKPGPLFSGKIAGSISSIINRLQDNLQPNLAASPSIQDAQNSTRTEAMPSLIHYKDLIPDSQPQQTNKEEPPPLSHYKNLMDSNKKNEVILSAGPIRILRNPDGAIIYACFVTRCVFSSENSEQFATHCQITHGKLSYKSWRCKLCKDTFINNGLYEVFLHLLEKHLDSAILKLENSKIDLAPPDDPQGDDVIPTIDITSDSNLSDLNPKRDYIRPVPLFKLLEDSDNPETPPSLQKTPVEDEINLNSINKKFSYVIDCQLNGPQAAHFYKCPVFNCTFTSFAAQDFFAHILQHPNSYVFCLYCSNIVKLSLYFKHLEESHFSARFACSHCFYRGNNMSYVSAHIDTHHKGKDRQMVVTPIETMPTGVHMGDLPPLFTLVKPYKCAEMGCHKETIFSQEFMHHISSHKSKNVVCADCGRTLGLTILRHYAAQHGVCAFHCRYCEYGSQSADAVIRHLSEQHSNMPFLILSRKRSDKNFPSGTDEFDMMLVFTEKMIKSKYTSLIQNKDVQSVLSTITLKKKAVKRRKKGSKELIPFAQACIELSASIGGDEEISLYGTELKKQQQAKNVTKQTLINLDATPSTSSVTLNGPIATSSLLLDGTIYPSCQICGLQVTNKMCEHLPYWNSNQLYKGRVITSRLVTNQGSEVIVRNKLVADGIIQPKYVPMNRYVCGGEDCELIFELKEVLAEHLELFHSNETAYICRHCNIQLDFLSNKINIALVMKHMGVHEETIYKCRYCYFMDDVAGSMQEHTAQMHPNQENTTLLKISREQPAAKCDSESNEVIILTNSDDDNSSSVINEGSVSETQCAGDNEDDYVNVEDEDGGGADLGEDDVNFLNIITSSTTQELEEEKGLIKPYGPHYRFEKDCYKCPVCGDAIHGAIKFNNHLLDETSRIKGIYLSKSSSKEDLTDWIHKVIRHQTLILHFWTDTSNITSRVCRFCPAMCWKKRWYVHEMIHFDNAKPFQCNQCQFECFGKESIDHHTKKHTSTKVKTPLVKNSAKPTNVKSFHELTDDEKFLFEICPTSDFHNPETIFTDKIRKVCFYCKFQGNYIEIVKHCRLRHPGSDVRGFSFKCLNCEDYFDTAAVFRSHNLLCHDGNAKASFNYVGDRLHTCADCGKTYYDRRLLMLHEKTHSDSYMCKYCEFATFNWRLLAKHHFDQHAHELFDFIYDFEPSTSEVAEN